MENKEYIDLWKTLEITNAKITYDCGGDSFGNSECTLYKNDLEVDNEELSIFLEDDMHNNVEFYVNSDGHYQGEYGTVHVTLESDKFFYQKDGIDELFEQYTRDISFDIDEKEFKVLSKISDFTIGFQDKIINYKQDCILTNEDVSSLNNINERLIEFLNEYVPELTEDEMGVNYEATSEYDYIEFKSLEKDKLNTIVTLHYNVSQTQ